MTPNKYGQAAMAAEFARTTGGNVVFVNGCFDVLHPGHVDLINKAHELKIAGGWLIVGVNSDASVRSLKGQSRPIFPLEHRMSMLRLLPRTNYVCSFDEETPRQLIEAIRPDIIVKGGDYEPKDVVGNDVAEVVIVPLYREHWEWNADIAPYWSTSEIIKRMRLNA